MCLFFSLFLNELLLRRAFITAYFLGKYLKCCVLFQNVFNMILIALLRELQDCKF